MDLVTIPNVSEQPVTLYSFYVSVPIFRATYTGNCKIQNLTFNFLTLNSFTLFALFSTICFGLHGRHQAR
jgi:hypothetical protein